MGNPQLAGEGLLDGTSISAGTIKWSGRNKKKGGKKKGGESSTNQNYGGFS